MNDQAENDGADGKREIHLPVAMWLRHLTQSCPIAVLAAVGLVTLLPGVDAARDRVPVERRVLPDVRPPTRGIRRR